MNKILPYIERNGESKFGLLEFKLENSFYYNGMSKLDYSVNKLYYFWAWIVIESASSIMAFASCDISSAILLIWIS